MASILFSVKTDGDTETASAGERLARLMLEKDIVAAPQFIAMYGELGAGKTAFVRGMAAVIAPDEHVTSPTYAIINAYEGIRRLYHLDLYRITSDDDLYSVGFYELFDDTSCIIAAEWCENIPYALPESRIEVKISRCEGDEREIEVTLC